MNKKEVVNQIAIKAGLSKRLANKVLDTLIETIGSTLSKGERVTITRFGTFIISRRKERLGVNPRNPKEKIKIPASVLPRFRPGSGLRSKIK